jgi:hypothetical protein
MNLRGYRSADRPLLTGAWLAGELLGVPPSDRPMLAPAATMPPPADDTAEVCVAPGRAVIRFAEIDWVHRRARLEIGVQPDQDDTAALVVDAAVAHGFDVLNLRRIYGWVTPAAQPSTDLLERAGFQREAAIPNGYWLDGQPVEREIWGVIRHD